MSNWEGFTDEDLRRIKGEGSPKHRNQVAPQEAPRSDRRPKANPRSRPARKPVEAVAGDLPEGCFFNANDATKTSASVAAVGPAPPQGRASASAHTARATFNRTSGVSTYGTCIVDRNGEAHSRESRRACSAPGSASDRVSRVTTPEAEARVKDIVEKENSVRVCTDEELQR